MKTIRTFPWTFTSFLIAALKVLCAPPACCADSTNCSPPLSGLISWWRGEGNTADTMSNNPGALVGNTTFGPGRVGQAFVLDGYEDGVQLGSPANLQLQDFTVEAWIKRSSASRVSAIPGLDGGFLCYGAGGYGFGLYRNTGQLFLSSVGVGATLAAASITDTNFHHVAVTKSGTAVVFYVDGVAYAAQVYFGTLTFTTPVAIGARGDNLANSFWGSIDELAVYGRALSAPEIQAIYQAADAGKCTEVAPTIISQPANLTVYATENATFGIAALGTPPLTYQWAFEGSNIPGATNSTLALTNVQLTKAGHYSAAVTNLFGFAVSSNAVLTVNPPPPCAPPPVGLISWWRAEGNNDDAIDGNDGGPAGIGDATFGPGRVGQAFVFDGSGDAVYLGNPPNLHLQDFTIEAWIKRSSPANVNQQGSWAYLLADSYGEGFGFGLNEVGFPFLSGPGLEQVTLYTHISDINWHHVAVTKAGTNVVFYIDGTTYYPLKSFNGIFTFNSNLGIGATGNAGNSFWGSIDELSIYNRALSAYEMQIIYNAILSGKCLVPLSLNPKLNITQSGTNVILGWPGWAADFTLLTSGGINGVQDSWTNLSGPMQTNGSTISISLPIDQEGKFFRLYHP